jgi:hypothetical protein
VLVGVGETAASVTQVHVIERRARHRRGPHRQARVVERGEDGWQGRRALVGAGALGYDVIAGFAQSEDYGKGLAAAFSIVLLGIMLDRITQGAGTKRPRLRMAAG